MAGLLIGCPPRAQNKGDGGADGGGEDALAAADDGATPLAANQADITQYPDQTQVNHAPLSTEWLVSNVRTQASTTSDLVAVIRRGTAADKIGEYNGFYLILFTDPSDSSRQLMGWVSHSVFSAEPPHPHVTIHCPAGQVAILLQAGAEQCVVECQTDGNCPTGLICDGDGVLSNNGQPGSSINFCRIGKRTGPPPPPPPVVDAGHATVVDAGTAAKPLDVHKDKNGNCPAGYKACNIGCRLTCTSAADCGVSTATCQSGFCLGPRATPCK
jgi:hypothetical protein